ncbi:MAG: DUF4010 domain-containing protein [Verrucomicrobiota bacterium]|nr:DUF4010 domain-containing protein [Verrucomicrobiota bacterium]
MEGWKPDFPALDFLIALFIGGLIGLERERRQEGRETSAVGGLRTFILLSETGAISAWLSARLGAPWIFVAASLMIGAILVTRYYLRLQAEPQAFGMTTEIAAVVVFLLGGTALFGHRELAVALAVVTLGLLAYKQPLHGLVGKVGSDDLAAVLKLLFAAFIVLPVLPNRAVDPWSAINPHKTWWLVILIAAISFVGYVASRWLGRRRGAALTGLFGGLVSSTAVTLSFARQSRDDPSVKGMANALAAGVLASWVMMLGRVLVITAVLCQPLARRLVAPILIMAAAIALSPAQTGMLSAWRFFAL